MIDLEISAEIPARAEAVWAVLGDYRHDADWRTGVIEMQPDPLGPSVPGTTTHEVMRLGGRTYVNDGVVDVVVPGERLEWHTTQGAEASGSREVTELPDGRCRVTLRLRVRPRGAEVLIAALVRATLRTQLRKDLRTLRELVLADVPTVSRPA